jgi:WD40 repeat protein
MLILKGMQGEIGSNTLVYSPSGDMLLAGDELGVVKAWSLTGEERFTIHKHERLVTGLGFCLGGVLVTGSWDCTVRFWDAGAGAGRIKQLRRFQSDAGINCLVVSPDGKTVAAAGGGWATTSETVSLWEVGDKPFNVKRLDPVGQHDTQIGALAFDPKGRWLASGSADNTARVWELATGKCLHNFKFRTWVQGLRFSPDGSLLAVAAGASISLFDTATGAVVAKLTSHKKKSMSVAFSPSGRTLVSGSFDGTVCCWDVPTRKARAVYRWKIGQVEAVAFSPDGMTAAAGGHADIVIWDIDAD